MRVAVVGLLMVVALLAACGGGSKPGGPATAEPSARATDTATPTATPPLPTVACDPSQVTYRGEVLRVPDSDGAGNPGMELRVFAASPEPCILRRGGIDVLIVIYPNQMPQKMIPTGSYDLLPHPRAEVNAYLPEAQPVAIFMWKNSCTVPDAQIKLLVDTVAFFSDRLMTTGCAPGASDARTDLVVSPVTLSGPTPSSLEEPLPAGFNEAAVDLTQAEMLHVVVSADAPDDGRVCEKLFPWMVPPAPPANLVTKVVICRFGGYGRPHFAARTLDPATLYLWRTEILLPALAGLPGQQLNSSCEEIAPWVVEASADPDSAAYVTVCDARVVVAPAERGKRIWVDVFPEFAEGLTPDTPCWQLSAFLRTGAGEGKVTSVQCELG